MLLLCVLLCGICIPVFAEDNAAKEDTNIFASAFEEVTEHSAEILSALAFAGSTLLTFSYKRAMLPTLKHGIATIGNVVNDIKSSQEDMSDRQTKLKVDVTQRLKELEDFIKKLESTIGKTEITLENLNTGTLEREKLAAVIGEQVSLLYDVFMFSSIPEYQKDAVGRRVEMMRKILDGGEVKSDEKQLEA